MKLQPALPANGIASVNSKKNKGAGKPAPRTHQKHWQDNTITQRQQSRREKLNQIARAAGFASWSAFETAALNGKTRLTPLALDGGDSAASEQLSTPEVLSTLQGESNPAHRK